MSKADEGGHAQGAPRPMPRPMGQQPPAPRYPARFRELTWYRRNVPCMQACPVHTDSGRYVQLIAESRLEEAFLVARGPNPLASVCGRICAAPCEDACRRAWVDHAITIRPLKRFITERFGAESSRPDTYESLLGSGPDAGGVTIGAPGCQFPWGMPELSRAAALDRRSTQPEGGSESPRRKVAVIGSGPAGLACAHDLSLLGHEVRVLEAMPAAGGMLRYGIPEYRLPRSVIDREVALIEHLGAEIRTGARLSAEHSLSHLRDEGYEAFFISVGAMHGRDLDVPGSDKDGVIKAVDYLLNLNRGYRVDLGDKVVVIGGGAVAFDAARSALRDLRAPMEEIELTAEAVVGQPAMDAARGALRSGASEVHVVALESLDEMPASRTVQGRDELHEALEEGIRLHPSWGPGEILGEDHVTGIELVAVTRVFDEDGRFSPTFDHSRTLSIEADSIILAIGQRPDLGFLSEADQVELTAAGTIKIDPRTLATTADGIYAGGDAAFGPRIAIEAVANGKTAARSIHSYLTGSQPTTRLEVSIETIPAEQYSMPAAYERRERRTAPTVDLDRRTGITEVELVMGDREARHQAERCLCCHVDTIYNAERCVLCNRCADVCPEKCLTFVPVEQVEMPDGQLETALEHYGHDHDAAMTALLKDDTACIRCGLCARRCPTDAITMERFSFAERAEPPIADAESERSGR